MGLDTCVLLSPKMKLVIVESPTKAKTLQKFLGEGYEVLSSKGHLVDLPKKNLGVDVEHDFTPEYDQVPGKKEVITELKKAAAKAEEIFLATDPDREGEAIAWHIKQLIGDHKTKRVAFHEITEEAVKESFLAPREINQQLVDSQQARRVLDRLVGYKLSPLLWKKVRYGLSAGRVQSVAVRLVVDREKERQAFHPEEYWEILAKLSDSGDFEAKLLEKDGVKIAIGSQEDSDRIAAELKKEEYLVSRAEKSERRRHPYPPYTTSTLQQAGVNVLGFSGKRTMRAAQALYEAGLITYHRTDSTVIGEKALEQIRNFIGKNYGSNYLPADAIRYKTKVRLAQEAHEAIRPTKVELTGEKLDVSGDEKKVYELVWRQTVASQMLPAVYEQVSADIQAGSYLFRATGSKLIFDGWERLNRGEEARSLPELKEGEKLKLLELVPSQHFTEPLARYTEATLIKKLEEEGIGRPSTYAPIISTIQDRGYVSKEGRALKPEDAGGIVNDKILVPYFTDVVDLSFTAKMEEGFDEIARGEKNWVELIRGFYGPFSQELEKAEESIDKSSMTTIAETDEKCPDSGHPLVIKLGRYGRFYSCTGFPECKYARPYIEKIGMSCPDCKEGEVIIKKTRRGKNFYGCSRYPDCKFASWKDPRPSKPETPSETPSP
ncbi:MAG: topoisomerase I, DNA topoisomerase I protein [candidate division WWE3 bacterium CSP1-7]|uniref:DNA topoisomerase 1 n=1 Tax=candidate division WWE3 bacterium CSP1-7 TaxID=1576480 RepID=A0A0T5ZWR2_UNCKA|nr:MAG: topoisomerase I, DNA topoisomerase I protein [candidate division WWE3 bacterium CSP1-7]